MNFIIKLLNLWILTIPLFLLVFPAFGESHPEFMGMENPSSYLLEVDEHEFTIYYQVNAEVLAMKVDQELSSLLIGLDNTEDSLMIIDLDSEIISAENNQFAILVNGIEVDYTIQADGDSSTLSFFVPVFTEEVEIIGTRVIPEFPIGLLAVFSGLVGFVVLITRTRFSILTL